ncbi:uncharacterized protein LOC128745956 [Sabethes cyaneus]|uniref:uncharacterized protein LOC128745956 n=1 Tax=Sabethes cyaneus TaxID=53552 RepID=UPI00237EB51D|nr:uncharacterized protein LOC128745956 [Sabethes cyaneus]
MAEQQKTTLLSRRDTIIAALQRTETFVAEYNEERDKLQVPLRIQYLDNMWATLESVQGQLEDMEASSEDRQLLADARASFEPRFFATKANLISKFPTSGSNNSRTPVSAALSGIKLPTIALPEFDGDYNQWLAFHDTFLALIHSNQEVPAIQKFHYLKAAVKGEAAQLIESIAISSGNYQLAWDTLISRYANEYLLKKRHLQALFDIPSMEIETAATLHWLIDEFQRHVKILHRLGEPTELWSSMLEHLLCSRLHDDSLKTWEDHASTLSHPNYECLVEFLQRRVRVLESIAVNHHISPSSAYVPVCPVQCHATSASSSTDRCPACSQPHSLIRCDMFHRLSPVERQQFAYSKRLCNNCLRIGHIARNCTSEFSCRKCYRRHNTLLHPDAIESQRTSENSVHFVAENTMPQPTESTTQATNIVTESTPSIAISASTQNQAESVFLMTAIVSIVDAHGQSHSARALLDSASQPNLISERLARILQLKKKRANVTIQSAGNLSKTISASVATKVRSRRNSFSCDADFLVMDHVTANLPSNDVSIADWKIPNDVFLADSTFNSSTPIDLVLGAKHFCSFFPTAARMERDANLPLLVESVFGWVETGAAKNLNSNATRSLPAANNSLVYSQPDNLEAFAF